MKQELVTWRRGLSAAMALAVLMAFTAVQAQAVEPKGILSAKQVKSLVMTAATPADHMKLAHHYAAMAEKHEAEAAEHEALAAEYTSNPQVGSSKHPMAANTAEHCKFFAEHCRAAAKEMRAMSAAHEEMAKNSQK
jgi:hypothetical protein